MKEGADVSLHRKQADVWLGEALATLTGQSEGIEEIHASRLGNTPKAVLV